MRLAFVGLVSFCLRRTRCRAGVRPDHPQWPGRRRHGQSLVPRRRSRFAADKIVAMGKSLNGVAKREIDAKGLVVAPGFIDMHSHSDTLLLEDGNATEQDFARE